MRLLEPRRLKIGVRRHSRLIFGFCIAGANQISDLKTRPQPGQTRLSYALYVRNSDTHPARLVKLIATPGALDVDDPAPAITVMPPDED